MCVFRYCRTALATLSLSKDPWARVLPIMILLAVLTASSARMFDGGRRQMTVFALQSSPSGTVWNINDVKGGPPSLLNSSAAPHVWKMSRQIEISLDALVCPWFKWCIMSLPVSLSAHARYFWFPTWNRYITICWNGQSGDGLKVMGSLGWIGAIFEHSEQLALVVRIETFIPGQ